MRRSELVNDVNVYYAKHWVKKIMTRQGWITGAIYWAFINIEMNSGICPLTMNDTLKLSLRMGYEKRSNYVYLCFLVLIFIKESGSGLFWSGTALCMGNMFRN